MDHLCYLGLEFVMLSHLFIAALWSPAGKGLTSWLLFVMFNCDCVTLPSGILGHVWYLIVSIPDLCPISYFEYYVNDSFWVPTPALLWVLTLLYKKALTYIALLTCIKYIP